MSARSFRATRLAVHETPKLSVPGATPRSPYREAHAIRACRHFHGIISSGMLKAPPRSYAAEPNTYSNIGSRDYPRDMSIRPSVGFLVPRFGPRADALWCVPDAADWRPYDGI